LLRDTYGIAGRPPLGELLFSVHTFFALVARLVAIEVLALSIGDRDAEPCYGRQRTTKGFRPGCAPSTPERFRPP